MINPTKTLTSVQDVLEETQNDFDYDFWSEEKEQKDNEVIDYKCNPLLAMYINTREVNDYLDFNDVFNEDITKIRKKYATPQQIQYIDDVIFHFTTELATQKLQGYHLTNWQEELVSFLRMCETNSCKRKHKQMFCKLPWFYKEHLEFTSMCESFKSLPSSTNPDYHRATTELKPIRTIKKWNNQSKGKMFYYFTDREGHLYEYVDRHSDTTNSIIFSLWTDFSL